MANDYGDPSRGLSFEETNFRSSLEGMGHELIAYDFMEQSRQNGKQRMRADLLRTAAETKPDVAFFCLFTDELDISTIEGVGREGRCPTVNWFADDHWRFDIFTRHIAPAFDLAVTTDEDSLAKYAAEGIDRVHLSQWACNRYAYSRANAGENKHSVTFVGQPHGNREATVERLRSAGHQVECWGMGWPAGRLDHDGMVRVFGSSAINLNLSNSSLPPRTPRVLLGRLLGRGPKGPRPAQIKGRNFEVPGCGGFLLTERVPHLERYYDLGGEVGVFEDEDDLVEQVAYWLEHEERRAAVAEAGYRRTMAEHTYDHRFEAIFRAMEVSG